MGTRSIFVLLLISIVLLATPVAAQEPARFALLIANQKYLGGVGELQNPHKDIAVVDRALTQIGFKDTQSRRDVSREGMLFATHELARRLRQAGKGAIGFLYYTGHGVSVGGENVLVPVNAERTTDEELSVRGVRLSELLDILMREAPDAVLFVVLDACRNNIGGRRGAKGFAPVNDQRTGVVIAFATAAGATASDEGATSGPYAAALADEIVKPGQTDQAVFNAVRTRVVAKTRGAQVPWTHDGLVGERVVFSSGKVVPTLPAPQPLSEAALAWERIKDSRSISVLEAFAKQFAGTVYAALAVERVGEMRRRAEEEKTAADQQRIAILQKQDEDRRRVEALGAEAADDARRKAELVDDEAKRRDEEQVQLRAEWVLRRDTQIQLQRIGCDPGSIDGIWGPQSRSALRSYSSAKGRIDEAPNPDLLKILHREPTTNCGRADAYVNPPTIERPPQGTPKTRPSQGTRPAGVRCPAGSTSYAIRNGDWGCR